MYVYTCGEPVWYDVTTVDLSFTSHGGSAKVGNVLDSPGWVDADGGSAGGVLSAGSEPNGTTVVVV